MKPLCFVLMPFGTKPDPTGGKDIDFNRVYRVAIKPAIIDAGMEPIRADEEKTGGIIHGPMFERLLLCDFAIADLTTANANVTTITLLIFFMRKALDFCSVSVSSTISTQKAVVGLLPLPNGTSTR